MKTLIVNGYIISLTSTGYDRLNPAFLHLARERGVTVCNIADYGTPVVSQHTIVLLLELSNRVAAHDAAVKQGRWGANGEFCFWDNPLLTAKNCLITPHMAWVPREIRQRLIDCAVANLRAYLNGSPIHVINP